MNAQENSLGTHYLYCLVDLPNKRFKLGTTPHRDYAPSIVLGYCPLTSFQVGCLPSVAKVGLMMFKDKHAGMLLEKVDDGAWFSVDCFDLVRAVLLKVPCEEPPALLIVLADQENIAQRSDAIA